MARITGKSSPIFNHNNQNPFSRLEEEDIISTTPSRIIVFDRVSRLEFRFFGRNFSTFFDPPRGTITRITNERGLEVSGFSSPLSDWFNVFIGNSKFNTLISNIQRNNDSILGSSGRDTLYGYGGNDNINGRDGSDSIQGGAGTDTLSGSTGQDTLNGGNGNDILIGGAGADRLIGGSNRDNARYINSLRRVIVNLDTGRGSAGDADGDTLVSVESLSGSPFSDILIGDNRANSLLGLNGNDRIIGGSGNDFIVGDNGRDTLTGGSGNDRFRFTSNRDSLLNRIDRITDLDINNDQIDFNRAITSRDIVQRGQISSLSENDIDSLLGQNFSANRGATFGVKNRTYLFVNDSNAGYQRQTDSIIDITGYSGNLSNLQIV